MKVKHFFVHKHENGMRLSSYLKGKVSPQFSGKKIQEAIHDGICRVNGKLERFSSYKVSLGDCITIDFGRLSEHAIEETKLRILYEDEYLLCINKSPKLVCNERSFPGLFLVHRLDKDTSGCLLLAKAKSIQDKLETLFATKAIGKVYLALVYGYVKKEQWVIENTLGPKQVFNGQTIYGAVPNGKKACTYFQRIKQYKEYALIKCVPVTGRTHQIRVHLRESGHPIVGDLLYAKEKKPLSGVFRQLLHAHSLKFQHPVTNEEMTFVAPLPKEYAKVVKSLVE